MLFCRNCGSEVDKGSRYCEKCFADLRADGAVIDNIGIASSAAMNVVETGRFSADAVITGYDLCGCRIGNILLTEKKGFLFGNDIYKGIDNNSGRSCLIKYFTVSEKQFADRYSLASGKRPRHIAEQAEMICINEAAAYTRKCRNAGIECPMVSMESFLSKDKSCCHIFAVYSNTEPFCFRLREMIRVRDLVRYAIDICDILVAFERNRITYNSIFEENIYITPSDKAVLGAEYERAMQLEFIETPAASSFTSYLPPDPSENESSCVYSLAVMLYRILNNGNLPYMNFYSKERDYSDRLKAEMKRYMYSELQLPVLAENMLGNLLCSIIGNSCRRNIQLTDVRKTLENALDFLPAEELDKAVRLHHGIFV